jgi:hypothetical protein
MVAIPPLALCDGNQAESRIVPKYVRHVTDAQGSFGEFNERVVFTFHFDQCDSIPKSLPMTFAEQALSLSKRSR